MPWTCCRLEHLDDLTHCSQCGQRKPKWTVRFDRTRRFVIPKKKPKHEASVAGSCEEDFVEPACEAVLKEEGCAPDLVADLPPEEFEVGLFGEWSPEGCEATLSAAAAAEECSP